MSVLAIDVGNSRVGLAVFTRGKSADPAIRLAHADLDKDLESTLRSLWKITQGQTQEQDDEESAVVLASVVPALTEHISEVVMGVTGSKPLVVGKDMVMPLKTKLRDEATTGVDRLLAAVAAYVNVEKACAIVHLGTALVVDCIDDEGVFLGGAIAPGLRISATALHEYAAQLPEVSLTPPEDTQPFGRFTQEAINLGIYAAARGTVRELLERYAAALGSWPHVVATGGDASSVFGDSDLADSLVPDLVLQGAALVWEHHRQG